MFIRATHTTDGKVIIIKMECGSPRDCKELLVVYFVIATGEIKEEHGNVGATVLAKFIVTE